MKLQLRLIISQERERISGLVIILIYEKNLAKLEYNTLIGNATS